MELKELTQMQEPQS